MTADGAYAAERRRRALVPLVRALGERAAVVGDLPPVRGLRPLLVCRQGTGGDVVGRPDALPVQSGALSGVLVATDLDEASARVLAECARLVRPGGCVVAVGTAPDGRDSAPLASATARSGLVVERAVPVGASPARPRIARALRGVDAAFDRLALRLGVGADGPVELAVVLRRGGGDGVELPRSGELLLRMFVPGRGRPGRPRR